MWLTTSNAFLSAVAHRDDSSKLMVRARDHESLMNLVEGLSEALEHSTYTEDHIYGEGGSDYKWRMVVDRIDYAAYVSHEVLNYIVYDNFKKAATAARGEQFHSALIRVWSVMHDLTRNEELNDDWNDDDVHDDDDDLPSEFEDILEGLSQEDLDDIMEAIGRE